MSVAIQTNDLTKRYGTHVAVSNVNLEVRRGEVFGYLGPNGAGKTTTIRTLLDFIRPTSGSASIFGLDSRRRSSRSFMINSLPGVWFRYIRSGRMRADVGYSLRGNVRATACPGTAERPKAAVAMAVLFTKTARHDRLRFVPLEVEPIAFRPEEMPALK